MNIAAALANTLIPREANNHKAHILKTPILAFLLLLFLLTQKTISTTTSPQVLGFASQISPAEVIRLTNIKRAEAGLSSVSENASLDKAAKAKGEDMLAKGYWAHVAPDGTQPWDFFKSVNYKYRYAGENLARDFTNPASAVDAWMASPSHRENMLSNRYKEIGVAVVDGSLNGKDATIIVQLFGTTMAASSEVSEASAANENKSVAAVPPAKAPEVLKTNEEVPVVEPVSNTESFGQAGKFTIENVNAYPKILSFGIVGFILGALIVDSFIIWFKGHSRRSGKPFAQIAFLGMILAIIIVAKAGQIL